ncbi:hypothetical protein B9J07_32600 [Sinorhizobium sp. LM21]|nr:hypothetical protein B9J07_32600 [Sinorhizobium sp. LM21]
MIVAVIIGAYIYREETKPAEAAFWFHQNGVPVQENGCWRQREELAVELAFIRRFNGRDFTP